MEAAITAGAVKRVPRSMREAGPYEVRSRADGVLLVTRPDTDLVSRSTLASDLEAMLNAPYRKQEQAR